ncbi:MULTISPECIES: hypothetical protein [unclassified Streptomyces]|uniref:hypothetical protein n=1 Tax=unclassified Streptomyces TaxID=2593676 RepID=UPI0035D6B61A
MTEEVEPTPEPITEPPLSQAHILHSEGADPAVDRFVRENARVRMIAASVRYR